MKSKIFAAVMIGALMLTSCIKEFESASVTEIRKAKAAELNSVATLNNAKAAAEAVRSSADAALALAQARLYEAQAESQEIRNKVDALDYSIKLETAEYELATAILNAQKALLDAQKDLREAAYAEYADLVERYTTAWGKVEEARADLIDAKAQLENAKNIELLSLATSTVQIEVLKEKIAYNKEMLEAYKEYLDEAPTLDELEDAAFSADSAKLSWNNAKAELEALKKVYDFLINGKDGNEELSSLTLSYNEFTDEASELIEAFVNLPEISHSGCIKEIPNVSKGFVYDVDSKYYPLYIYQNTKADDLEFVPVEGNKPVATKTFNKYEKATLVAENFKIILAGIYGPTSPVCKQWNDKVAALNASAAAATYSEIVDKINDVEKVLAEAWMANKQAKFDYKLAEAKFNALTKLYNNFFGAESEYTKLAVEIGEAEAAILVLENILDVDDPGEEGYGQSYAQWDEYIEFLEAEVAEKEDILAAAIVEFENAKDELEHAIDSGLATE